MSSNNDFENDTDSTYTQLTHEEHIEHAPDTYVGSIEKEESVQYIINDENKIIHKSINIVPAFYKIFDEILVNAEDQETRLIKQNCKHKVTDIWVNINKTSGYISVKNNGEGINIKKLEEYDNIYAPSLIFGKLLTGSNYDKNEDKETGGKNGYGAKLCNIFSKHFIVITVDSKRKLHFRQEWRNNMKISEDPIITDYTCQPYTEIIFQPDYNKFGMEGLDDDTFSLFKKRVYDVSAWTSKKVNVYFNDNKLEIKDLQSYAGLYLDENQERVYEKINDKWEVILTYSNDDNFKQVSFVNGICTTKGGKHVEYIVDQIKTKLIDNLNKKRKDLEIRPNTIKNQLFIFLKSVIINPSFDSQTKETLTTNKKNFKSTGIISDITIQKLMKTKIIENIISENEYKSKKDLKRSDGKKSRKIVGIPKYCGANKAGSQKYSKECTLILTEGDSAKTTAVAGLSVVGRDLYGVFPLKGKLLNVKDVTQKKIQQNDEINNLVKILGLKYKHEYNVNDPKWELRYGKIMIMTDQDHDGSHIKGLVMNLFHTHWPSLFENKFITSLITPIIKCFKGNNEKSFFTLKEYEDWKENTPNLKLWRIKYYKGLGTSNVREAKEYFTNMNVQSYIYEDEISNQFMNLAFNKKHSDKRKLWLSEYSTNNILNFGEKDVLYSDFINKELIHFSQADCRRSIPDIRDGFKPSQRKILYSCFKRNLTREIKVAQLAGYVSEHSNYHHGEMSLNSSIVALAQNFLGSNNINLLYPSGQFGSRLLGGKDSASCRYIFTRLSEVTKYIFKEQDKNILNYLEDDGDKIEPECYYPIIPMILINGSMGIGTGYSSNIPNFSPNQIIKLLLNKLDGKDFAVIKPYYNNFKGSIKLINNNYQSYGLYEIIDNSTIRIIELPIGVWTEDYKVFLDNSIKDKLNEDKKNKNLFIKSFEDNSSESEVDIVIKFTQPFVSLNNGSKDKLIEQLKLKSSKHTNITNMVLYDSNSKIKKYNNISEILNEYYETRLEKYDERKSHLLESLKNECNILENKYNYIQFIISGELEIRNKKETELNLEMEHLKLQKINDSYDYLTDMKIKSLTKEKVDSLKEQYENKMKEIKLLESKTNKDLWRDDLLELNTFLKRQK